MIEILLQAERALSVGLLDRAETLYRQVASADPRNSIAVVGLARVTLDRGDEVAALDLARDALSIDPENDAAQRMVARLEEVINYRGAAAEAAMAEIDAVGRGTAPESAEGAAEAGVGEVVASAGGLRDVRATKPAKRTKPAKPGKAAEGKPAKPTEQGEDGAAGEAGAEAVEAEPAATDVAGAEVDEVTEAGAPDAAPASTGPEAEAEPVVAAADVPQPDEATEAPPEPTPADMPPATMPVFDDAAGDVDDATEAPGATAADPVPRATEAQAEDGPTELAAQAEAAEAEARAEAEAEVAPDLNAFRRELGILPDDARAAEDTTADTQLHRRRSILNRLFRRH